MTFIRAFPRQVVRPCLYSRNEPGVPPPLDGLTPSYTAVFNIRPRPAAS